MSIVLQNDIVKMTLLLPETVAKRRKICVLVSNGVDSVGVEDHEGLVGRFFSEFQESIVFCRPRCGECFLVIVLDAVKGIPVLGAKVAKRISKNSLSIRLHKCYLFVKRAFLNVQFMATVLDTFSVANSMQDVQCTRDVIERVVQVVEGYLDSIVAFAIVSIPAHGARASGPESQCDAVPMKCMSTSKTNDRVCFVGVRVTVFVLKNAHVALTHGAFHVGHFVVARLGLFHIKTQRDPHGE